MLVFLIFSLLEKKEKGCIFSFLFIAHKLNKPKTLREAAATMAPLVEVNDSPVVGFSGSS